MDNFDTDLPSNRIPPSIKEHGLVENVPLRHSGELCEYVDDGWRSMALIERSADLWQSPSPHSDCDVAISLTTLSGELLGQRFALLYRHRSLNTGEARLDTSLFSPNNDRAPDEAHLALV